MDEFPAKISTQTSSTQEAAGGSTLSWKFISLDVGFLRSILGILMIVEMVMGLLVWALVADSHYQYNPAYNWVMFVAIFCWIVTILFFLIYLLQLYLKLRMIPWSIVNLVYNVGATTLYITGFITCAAAVQSPRWTEGDYNKRAAASFFACVVMLSYGASCFFSFRMWRGNNSNAATSQAAGPNNTQP